MIASGANQNRPNAGSTDGEGIDPTTQLPSWTSGTTDATTLFLAKRIILTLYPGLYVSPIFQPDSSPLTTPVVDTTPWAPGSSGYGAGGKVELPVSTGGSEAQSNGGWSTTSPAGQPPSPGNMYSESTASPRSLISRQGSDEMTGSQIKRMVKDMKLNGYAGYDPIDVANVNGKLIIIDGHHRAEAAAKAGIRDVPIVVHEVTRQEGEALLQEAAEARVRRY